MHLHTATKTVVHVHYDDAEKLLKSLMKAGLKVGSDNCAAKVPVTVESGWQVAGNIVYRDDHLCFRPANPPGGINVPCIVLQAGDLCISLDGLERTLLELELYSPMATWRHAHLVMPVITGHGVLRFDAPGPTGFLSYDLEPCVEADEESGLVRIWLDGGIANSWVASADNLVAGLSSDGAIVDLWLKLSPWPQ